MCIRDSQNLDILRTHSPKFVLVLAGDHVYKMDYGKLIAAHVEKQADMTVACVEVPVSEASAFGVMGVDNELRVSSFNEKPDHPTPTPGNPDLVLASMGVYVFNTRFLYEQLVRDADDKNSSHDFGNDIIPHLVSAHYRVFAQSFEDSCVNLNGEVPYWRDVGTIDAYWDANIDLTATDPLLNLRLVEKLINLNTLPIPVDFLPLLEENIFDDYKMMYWPNGQKIMSASRIVQKNDNLFAVYMGNFRCGPDSFLTHFVRKEMKGKPYLHLEVDEHSADAGLITRFEAFLDNLSG